MLAVSYGENTGSGVSCLPIGMGIFAVPLITYAGF
jgi:hypothetical protein